MARGMPTLRQQLDDAVLGRLVREAHVLADRLADLVADRQRRVQAGERVLEDEPDLLAAQLAHVLVAELEEVDPVEHDRAGDDLARRIRDEAGDRQRRDALAAARFADQPERLAVADVEAHVVDRLDDAVGREEVGRQAADLEQVVGLAARPARWRPPRCAPDGRPRTTARRWSARQRRDTSSEPVNLLLSLELRVERVAQAVAEEGEADQRERDAGCREVGRGGGPTG